MSNDFIVRRGLRVAQGINATSITGTLQGTSSFAVSASWAPSSLPTGLVSSSLQLSGSTLTGNLIQSATFANYNERVISSSISAATLSLDLSQGNVFDVLVSQSMLVTFTNPPSATLADSVTLVSRYDGTRTLTWDGAIRWPGGTAPTISTTSGSTDIFTFVTINGGGRYFGVFSGKGY